MNMHLVTSPCLYYPNRTLKEREYLDEALSRAVGVPLDENGRISFFDENQYVLTLDFALKMLNIHERRKCKVPIVIEGETGVGKTALIEMLSKMWNARSITKFRKYKMDLLHSINQGMCIAVIYLSIIELL